MLKRVDRAVFEVIKSVASGSPMTGVQNFDLNAGEFAMLFPTLLLLRTRPKLMQPPLELSAVRLK